MGQVKDLSRYLMPNLAGNDGKVPHVKTGGTGFEFKDAGAFHLVSTTSISGSPSAIDISLPVDYKQYKLSGANILLSGNSVIFLRVSTDGVSFDSGATDYHNEGVNASGSLAVKSMNANAIDFGGWTLTNYEMELLITGARDSTAYTKVFYRTNGYISTAGAYLAQGCGVRWATQTDTHIRLYLSGNTFTSGTLYLYGIK